MAGLPLLCHHFYASKLVDPSRHVVFRPMVSRAAVRLLHRAVRLLPGKRTPHARKRTPRPEKRTPQPEKRPPQQEKRTPRQAPLFKAFPFFEASFAANSLLQGFSSPSQVPSQVTPSFFKASTPSSGSYPFFQGLYFPFSGSYPFFQGFYFPFSGSYPFFQGLYFPSSGSYPFFLSDPANSSLFQGSTSLLQGPIPFFRASTSLSQGPIPFFRASTSLSQGPILFSGPHFPSSGSYPFLQGHYFSSSGSYPFFQGSTSLLQGPIFVFPATQRTPPFFRAFASLLQGYPFFQGLFFPSSGLSLFSGLLLPFLRVLSFFQGLTSLLQGPILVFPASRINTICARCKLGRFRTLEILVHVQPVTARPEFQELSTFQAIPSGPSELWRDSVLTACASLQDSPTFQEVIIFQGCGNDDLERGNEPDQSDGSHIIGGPKAGIHLAPCFIIDPVMEIQVPFSDAGGARE